MLNKSAPNRKIFISYRRDDSRWQAKLIFEALIKAAPNSNVFMDVETIGIGEDFHDAVTRWLGQCDLMLVLIGPKWCDATDESGARRLDDPDDLVRIEIAEALRRDVPVVPILLDGASPPEVETLPNEMKGLSRRQAESIEFAKFEQDFSRLAARLGLTPKKRNARILATVALGAVVSAACAGIVAYYYGAEDGCSEKTSTLVWNLVKDSNNINDLDDFVRLCSARPEARLARDLRRKRLGEMAKDAELLREARVQIRKLEKKAKDLEGGSVQLQKIVTQAQAPAETIAWSETEGTRDTKVVRSFLKAYPNGANAARAEVLLSKLIREQGEAQTILKNLGYEVKDPPGEWGPGSEIAFANFARDRDLPEQLKLDKASLALLRMIEHVRQSATANGIGTIIASSDPQYVVGAPVRPNQRIKTGPSGSVQIKFTDQSILRIEPNTDLVLNKLVFDPDQQTPESLLTSVRTGATRFFRSRAISPTRKTIIQTPTQTIGVRG